MNAKSIYFGIFSNVFGNLLMLGATLWLTRILDPAQFGQFRVGSNFAVLMVPFLTLGGERLVSKLIQSNRDDVYPVARAMATVFTVVSFGVFLLAIGYPFLSHLIFNGNIPASVYYASIAVIPLTIAYNLGNTIWRHMGDAAAAQIHLNFTQRLLRAPLLIGTALFWPSALSASLSMALAQAISLFQLRKSILQFPLRGTGSAMNSVRTNLKEMLVIGVPVAIMAAVDRLDVLLINAVMGVAHAGRYDLVYMLSLTAMFPAMALSKTTEPFLYELSKDINKQKRLRDLQTRTFLLSCTAVLGIGIMAPILAHFLGNAGPDFSRAALILSAGLAFSSVHGPVIEYLQINGKAKLTLVSIIILIPIFFIIKYFAALTDSLVGVAALAGLFYFTLRMGLSAYIRIVDNVSMGSFRMLMLSMTGYAAVGFFILTKSI